MSYMYVIQLKKLYMNKIACMIVTYNRKNLLARLLYELEKQTFQGFDILVLNNGSQDDTLDFLKERKKILNNRLIIETIPVNKGMAYGYNRGYAAVFERGYEWIWTMDDDGIPAPNQLEELLNAHKNTNLLYLNAVVCDTNNHHLLAFPLPGISDPMNTNIEYLYGVVRPDNGTLINHEIYEKCGNIKSELISYGMETEYVFRIKAAGYKVATVMNAIHYHPQKDNKLSSIINFKRYKKIFVYNPKFFQENNYLSYLRANAYILQKYQPKEIRKEYIRLILFWVSRGYFSKLVKFIKAFNEGRMNMFPEI